MDRAEKYARLVRDLIAGKLDAYRELVRKTSKLPDEFEGKVVGTLLDNPNKLLTDFADFYCKDGGFTTVAWMVLINGLTVPEHFKAARSNLRRLFKILGDCYFEHKAALALTNLLGHESDVVRKEVVNLYRIRKKFESYDSVKKVLLFLTDETYAPEIKKSASDVFWLIAEEGNLPLCGRMYLLDLLSDPIWRRKAQKCFVKGSHCNEEEGKKVFELLESEDDAVHAAALDILCTVIAAKCNGELTKGEIKKSLLLDFKAGGVCWKVRRSEIMKLCFRYKD